MEQWKDIKGYEGKYQVSNYGKVKAVEKMIKCAYGKHRKLKEKKLKPIIKLYGLYKDHERLMVNLYYDTGLYKTKQISRLVAESFIPGYTEELLVLHNDNDTHNNHYKNLRIGTYSDNNKQAWDDGRQKKRI